MTCSFLAVPDSPLVFRSGRPFGAADAGGGGESLAFPLPATTAGALRAAWCDAAGHRHHDQHDHVLHAIHVRGPLRCTVLAAGVVEPWLAAPADAVQTTPTTRRERLSLVRLELEKDVEPGAEAEATAGCDLPYGLRPLRLPEAVETGPAREGWALPELQAWLHRPSKSRQSITRTAGGALPTDLRTHVAIDSQGQRATDQGLFASEGLDFTLPAAQAESVQGLLLYVDAPADTENRLGALAGRHGRLGADGHTAAYVHLEDHSPPACPATLAMQLDAVVPGDLLRLYLATPACYLRNGCYPDGLRPEGIPQRLRGTLPGLAGWRFEVVAAAVGRFVAQAGYAMRSSGAAGTAGKPLRRLVPAGSVYWLRVLEREENATPLSQRWWQSTCYVEFARDGHGLGLWGLA